MCSVDDGLSLWIIGDASVMCDSPKSAELFKGCASGSWPIICLDGFRDAHIRKSHEKVFGYLFLDLSL